VTSDDTTETQPGMNPGAAAKSQPVVRTYANTETQPGVKPDTIT
jgi:hypothetical protein